MAVEVFVTGALATSLAGVVGLIFYGLIRPAGAAQSAMDVGRKWAAWGVFASTLATLTRAIIRSDLDSFVTWLVVAAIFGVGTFLVGWLIGAIYFKGPSGLLKSARVAAISPLSREEAENSETSYEGDGAEDLAYARAWDELERGTPDRAAWAKAFAETEGDERKVRAAYLRLRVPRLREEERDRLRAAKIDQ